MLRSNCDYNNKSTEYSEKNCTENSIKYGINKNHALNT